MPVLPDVASRIVRSRVSAPDASPSRIIRAAARSFTDPPGFCHSAFAYSSTPGVSRSKRRSRTSGVRPIKSTTDEPALRSRTGQSGEEDIALYIRPNRSALYQKPFLLYSRRQHDRRHVAATSTRTIRSRHIRPHRRLAVPAPHLVAAPAGARAPADAVGRATTHLFLCWHRNRGARRAAPSLGRTPHRGHLAHAQRSAGPAGGDRTVRAGAQPAVSRKHRVVDRVRAQRPAPLDGSGRRCAARFRVPRDRALGRASARSTARRRVSRVCGTRAAMDTKKQAKRSVVLCELCGLRGCFLLARDVLQRARDAAGDRGGISAAVDQTENLKLKTEN